MGALVVDGAEHVEEECRLDTLPPALHPFEDGGRQLAAGPVVLIEQLELERVEEASRALFVGIADRGHRAEQPGAAQPCPEGAAGVLPGRCIEDQELSGANTGALFPLGRPTWSELAVVITLDIVALWAAVVQFPAPTECPSEEVHPPSARNSELIPNNACEAPSWLRAKQMMA